MNPTEAIALSVLDLSVLNAGATSADALQATTQLAIAADRLGYRRFWVAEHHNMPSVACTSPTVLIAHLAALTAQIRVGSGGVMLPNHAPLVVGEQFAMLEALHPGRIDLGIGRAPGTDRATAMALRGAREALVTPCSRPCAVIGKLQGATIRPGASLSPTSVWHALQSPLVCVCTMMRSLPPAVTIAR